MDIERLAISDAAGKPRRKEREEHEGILLQTQDNEPSVDVGREIVLLIRRKHGNSVQVSALERTYTRMHCGRSRKACGPAADHKGVSETVHQPTAGIKATVCSHRSRR